MEWSLNGLNLVFLAIGLCLGYWKCQHDNKVDTPSTSPNSESAQVNDNVEWDQLVGS